MKKKVEKMKKSKSKKRKIKDFWCEICEFSRPYTVTGKNWKKHRHISPSKSK